MCSPFTLLSVGPLIDRGTLTSCRQEKALMLSPRTSSFSYLLLKILLNSDCQIPQSPTPLLSLPVVQADWNWLFFCITESWSQFSLFEISSEIVFCYKVYTGIWFLERLHGGHGAKGRRWLASLWCHKARVS